VWALSAASASVVDYCSFDVSRRGLLRPRSPAENGPPPLLREPAAVDMAKESKTLADPVRLQHRKAVT